MKNIAVKAFVVKDEKILVLKQKLNEINLSFWELPGGKVENNESLEEAIVREIKEETAIEIKTIKVIGSQILNTNNILWQETVFLCNQDNDVVQINPNEHIEYRWVGYGELVSLKESAIQSYEIDFYKNYLDKSVD